MATFGLRGYRKLPYWARVAVGLFAGVVTGGTFAGMAVVAFLLSPKDPNEHLAPVAGSLLLAFAVFGLLAGILHPLARNRLAAVLIGAVCGSPLYLIVGKVSGIQDPNPPASEIRLFTLLGAIIGGIVGWRCWSEFQKESGIPGSSGGPPSSGS